MNSDKKMLVGIVGEPNIILINFLENLLSKNCYISIITDDTKGWNSLTININLRNRFSIVNKLDISSNQNFNYLIYSDGFNSLANVESNVVNFLQHSNPNIKTLVILPVESRSQRSVLPDLINDNLGVVYLGDVIGPRININSDLTLPMAIKEMYFQRTLSLPVGEIFYPMFVTDVIRILSKWLFSFGPYGKETLILGPRTSASNFWKVNQSIIKDLNPTNFMNIDQRILPRGCDVVNVNCDIYSGLVETYRWISQIKPENLRQNKKIVTKQKTYKKQMPKSFKRILSAAILLLISPLIFIIIGTSLIFVGYKGNPKISSNSFQNIVLSAKPFFVFARVESDVFKYIPLLNLAYRELAYISAVGENTPGLIINGLPIARSVKQLFDKSLGNEIFNVSDYLETSVKSIEMAHASIDKIQAVTIKSVNDKSIVAKKVYQKINFDKLKLVLVQGKILLSRTPTLLGADGQKTYLVLFQNNMELRPTGGFIGSYGLATFDKGRLSNLTVNDVYSADGQLNGHIEPPLPIKKYLGEANWWLRDSNWDPDFPTSAMRAEWFLDKEVGRTVDGVIALDLTPIKEILVYTGPIFLPDYNMDITSENLYEKTQAEVEQNFFPGTHKKASFLTALSQSLLSEVEKMESDKKMGVMNVIYKSLEARHLQVYLHDNSSNSALSVLNWDGSVSLQECGKTCYADFVGLAEANLGVNKVNYFIDRNSNLDVKLSKEGISHTLTISLSNLAKKDLGASGVYKTYLRLLVPLSSSITDTKVKFGQSLERIMPDISKLKGRQEVGVYVELVPGQSKDIVFEWVDKITFNSINKYGINIRKQAGIEEDPWSVNLTSSFPLTKDPRFTLTKDGVYQYNTDLVGDFFSQFIFK